jgi:hypothetical protein
VTSAIAEANCGYIIITAINESKKILKNLAVTLVVPYFLLKWYITKISYSFSVLSTMQKYSQKGKAYAPSIREKIVFSLGSRTRKMPPCLAARSEILAPDRNIRSARYLKCTPCKGHYKNVYAT